MELTRKVGCNNHNNSKYNSIITIIIETVTSNRLFLETGNVEKGYTQEFLAIFRLYMSKEIETIVTARIVKRNELNSGIAE